MISLALIVTLLTLTLNRSSVTRQGNIRVDRIASVIFNSAISTRKYDSFVRGLVNGAISLLLIVQQLLNLAKLRTLTLLAFRVLRGLLMRILDLYLPHRAAVLNSLPYNLLISRHALRAVGHYISLDGRVTILNRIRQRQLGVALNGSSSLAIMRDINPL